MCSKQGDGEHTRETAGQRALKDTEVTPGTKASHHQDRTTSWSPHPHDRAGTTGKRHRPPEEAGDPLPPQQREQEERQPSRAKAALRPKAVSEARRGEQRKSGRPRAASLGKTYSLGLTSSR